MLPIDGSATKGEILTVTVTDIARGGAGVAREPGGRVLFIPFTAPGDKLRVRVTEASKRYADAEVVEILEPSPQRVPPRCPVFGRCGGCQWQHLPYELQWKTKAGGVRHALERGGLTIPEGAWNEFPADNPWEYRNRVQLRGFGNEMGFYASRSHLVVDTTQCPVARREINAAWENVRADGRLLTQPYKVEVEVVSGGNIRKTWNAPHASSGFRQVNDEQNDKLRRWVENSLSGDRTLFDLFGGNGNLSLGLAARMLEVHCVDVSTPAKQAAPNHHFHQSHVIPWLLRRVKGLEPGTRPTSAILDPPRTGLAEGFTAIAGTLERLRVNELVAIGCDADSWVRDISRFSQRGWSIAGLAVFDFFPQTPHVESAALLRI